MVCIQAGMAATNEINTKDMMDKLNEYAQDNESDGEETDNSDPELPIEPPNGIFRVEEVVYSKRAPSAVPRSDGKVPAVTAQMQYVNEKRGEYLKEATPTAAELKQEAIKKIAQNEADRSRERLNATAAAQMKADKSFKKDFSGSVLPEHQENVRIMNSYKEKYAKSVNAAGAKFNYKFRAQGYNVNMDPAAVASERREVEVLLGAQNVPEILKNIGLQLVQVIEYAAHYLGGEEFNLDGSVGDFKANIQSGWFDEELEQLAIIWNPLFAMSPSQRLMAKSLWIFTQKFIKNQQAVTLSGLKSNNGLKIDPQLRKNTADL